MTAPEELIAFFDLTDLFAQSHRVPDVLVVGGFVLDAARRRALSADVAAIKERRLGYAHLPVKWNLRDPSVKRAARDAGVDHRAILQAADPVREELLAFLPRHDALSFVSVLRAHRSRHPTATLKRTRRPRLGYGFSNLLMHLGQCVKHDRSAAAIQIVLDWPEKSDPSPFVSEYASAWRDGASAESSTNPAAPSYHSGPLSSLGFYSGPHFGKTELDNELQLADLVVGCTKDFVDRAMNPAGRGGFGAACFEAAVYPTLHRSRSGDVLRYGLSVSPTGCDVATAVASALEDVRDRSALPESLVAEDPGESEWSNW